MFRRTLGYQKAASILEYGRNVAQLSMQGIGRVLSYPIITATDHSQAAFPTEVGNLINGAMIDEEWIN